MRARFVVLFIVLISQTLILSGCKQENKDSLDTIEDSENFQPIPMFEDVPSPTISAEDQTLEFSGRAISLRILQDKLKACQSQKSCSNDLLQLAGITKMEGFVLDDVNHDIILIGRVDDSLPHLCLDDFIIALRNVSMKYAERKENTYYYTSPGCSIDPYPRVIQKLQLLGHKMHENSSPEKMDKDIAAWRQTCCSLQKVRVFGVPFDSHFSWVMVKADYDMKGLVDGSDIPGIEGFASLSDMTMKKAKKDILKNEPISISNSSINRFWFFPGENLYYEDEGVVTIKKCPVVLLTEKEHADRQGKVSGTGSADSLAQEFAVSLTARYAEIARARPIYLELESLFRFVALVKIMKFKDSQKEAGLDLNYLLGCKLRGPVLVNKELPGRFNISRFDDEKNLQEGHRNVHLRLPSCGGVGIELKVDQNSFLKDNAATLYTLRKIVLQSRPSLQTLMWDYSSTNTVSLNN